MCCKSQPWQARNSPPEPSSESQWESLQQDEVRLRRREHRGGNHEQNQVLRHVRREMMVRQTVEGRQEHDGKDHKPSQK